MDIEVLTIKDKVQRYLSDQLDKVVVDSDGDFVFRSGSSQLWVSVSKVEEKQGYAGFVAVSVFANTNNRVPASPALWEYIATEGRYRIGALRCYKKDEGVRIFLEHTLVGDLLDPGELWVAINYISQTADWVDDVIKSKFGGVLYHEGSK